MTAAIERPKSTAYPSAGTCWLRPVHRQAVLDDERIRVGDEGGDAVADLEAGANSGRAYLDSAASMPRTVWIVILPQGLDDLSTSRVRRRRVPMLLS